MRIAFIASLIASPLLLVGQEANPTQSNVQPGNQAAPIFKVEVVSRTIAAISYRHRSGWTKVDFQGTQLAPKAHGSAEVNNGLGHAQIKLDVKDLPAPQSFGSEFLTYVLWGITPDGHAANLSEIVLDPSGRYHSDSISSDLQAFGLIITAEPYYAVSMPSDVVVMENIARTDTLGKQEIVDAKFELLPRGQYTYHVPATAQHPIDLNSGKKNPLELYEAMNAVNIAQYARADQFATDQFQAAQQLLSQAEDYTARKQWKPSTMTAKEAVQKAEDARLVSLRRQEQLAREKEQQDAAAREAAAKAEADAQARAAAQSAQQQQQAEQQARQAEQQARSEAEARAEAEKARQEADAARAQASAEAQRANAAADEANRLRAQAEQDKEALRQQLLQQFNSILQTTLTTRGLIINMSDVLFDFNKYSLKEPTREKLARLSGIILSHPGLSLKVEGYTDSIGSDEYNQKLSEQRADTVRQYLVSQGINQDIISSVGYGKQYPVASNDTSSGRAMNRRVDIVVSGEIIGIQIGVPPSQGQQPLAPNGAVPQTVPQGTPQAVPQQAPPQQ